MIDHLPDCPGVDPFETVGSRGDAMIRCRGCGRFTLAAEAVQGAALTRPGPRPTPPPDVPPSRYVARYGDKWPTHRSKARSKRYNRRTAIRKATA